MQHLSKSKLIAHCQCPKRLWLEVHAPELKAESSGALLGYAQGHEIGAIAQGYFGEGILIGHDRVLGLAIEETKHHLETTTGPLRLFEATFVHQGLLVRADIFERTQAGHYRLIEVKSSSEVKSTHVMDAAIQAWVIEGAGYPLERIEIAHVNKHFVLLRADDYHGLLLQADITEQARSLMDEVPELSAAARRTCDGLEPDVWMGPQCNSPNPCSYASYCRQGEPELTLNLLPRMTGKKIREYHSQGIREISQLPDNTLLADKQYLWRDALLSGKSHLNLSAIAAGLDGLPYPRYYLDFETVAFRAPRWVGTRPGSAYVFQWALLVEQAPGEVRELAFLAPDSEMPIHDAMLNLIEALGSSGPVVHYTPVERTNILTAAALCPDLAPNLESIVGRLFDMKKLVVEGNVIIPSMRGSQSIKAVHPALMGQDAYHELDGVADGLAASAAYIRMTRTDISEQERQTLREELLAYCRLDVIAMRDIIEELASRVGMTNAPTDLMLAD